MIKKILSGCGKAIFKCSGRTRCLIALGISSLVMFAVLAFSINTVSVSADGKQVVTLKTMLSDTESILKLADVQYSDEDLVTTDESLGKVEISVMIEDNSQNATVVEIDRDYANAYITALKQLSKR